MSLTLRNARIVTPDGVVHGDLSIEDGRIAAIDARAADESTSASGEPAGAGASEPTATDASEATGSIDDLGGAWLVPGFVDIHVHGGGGATYTTGDADEAREAARFHLRHGTTTTLASLVTSPPELMRSATAAYAPLVEEGVIAGIHYEGPYLSRARCGAQNPDHLRDPDLDELATLVKVGDGAIRLITVAPELPGALQAIEWLVDHNVTVAIGHTDATYQQARDGIAAGATVATHLFNGMRQPHHREPGPVYALLDAPEVVVELIADGVHLHDGTLRFAARSAGPARTALITDAISAAGMPDGSYELGGLGVTVADGVARLTDGGSIAGSTLTMDAAFRRAVHAGLSMTDAARMAATTPATALGFTDRGAIAPGKRADLVVLDDDLTVTRVMRAGVWVS